MSKPFVSRVDTFGTVRGGYTNALTGQGTSAHRGASTAFIPKVPLDRHEQDALVRFQSIARRIVWREPQDATRKGFTFSADVDQEVARRTSAKLKRLGLLKKLAEARAYERSTGGAGVIVFLDDGLLLSDPVDRSQIRDVKNLVTLDRHELHAKSWQKDPMLPGFGLPDYYTIGGEAGHKNGNIVHASRVLRFGGMPAPLREMRRNNGWGYCLLDLVHQEISDWATSNEYAAEAVTLLTQGVWEIEDLADQVIADGGDAVANRIESIRAGMGMMGDIIIDKGREDYKVVSRSLSGIGEALNALGQRLTASTDMPRSILMGETPGGLNSGENLGEHQSWADHVQSSQEHNFEPHITSVIEMVWASALGAGETGSAAGVIEWAPLIQMSELEKAQIRQANAQARALDAATRAVSTTEIRTDPDFAEHYSIEEGTSPPVSDDPPLEAGLLGPEEGEDSEGEESAVFIEADPDDIPEGENLISLKEAGARAGVGPQAIRGMIKRGEVPGFVVGNRKRVAWSHVARALKGQPTTDRAGGSSNP